LIQRLLNNNRRVLALLLPSPRTAAATKTKRRKNANYNYNTYHFNTPPLQTRRFAVLSGYEVAGIVIPLEEMPRKLLISTKEY
jgi:hypothetical protein